MAYVGIGGPFSVVKTLFAGVLFWFMVKFSFGRGLLTQVQYHLKKLWIIFELLKENSHSYHSTAWTACINSWISTQVCFFILSTSFQNFSHLVCSPSPDRQESRYNKNALKLTEQMTKPLFVLLKIHLVSLCHCCLISDGWNLFLPEVYGGGLHNRSGPLSRQAKCHYQHWNNRTRYCPSNLIWHKIFTLNSLT